MSSADLLDDILYKSLDGFTLPDVYLRLRQVMDSEGSTMTDAANVISMDPTLAARVLRMANSAFYGMRSQVDTINLAANVLGMQKLHDLTLAISVSKATGTMNNEVMDLNTFWHRSVHCGFLAKQIAESAGWHNVESIFVRGLLHDIGHLVLFSTYPDESRQVLDHSGQGLEGQMQEEQDSIGAHALQLTAKLAQLWQLPQSFIDTFQHLLHPEEVDSPLAREIAILNIAIQFTRNSDTDTLDEDVLEQVRPEIWEIAGLEPDAGMAVLDESTQTMSEAMYKIITQQENGN